MVNLQRQRKKTEEKHELEEEIGGSENVRIPNYLVKEFVSFVGELDSAVKSAGELARAVKSAGELVSVVGFDHRRIRNQSGELSDLELVEKEMCLGPMRFSPPDLTEIEGSLLSMDHQRGETGR
ncbi:hypothetical protein F2Q69_00047315 [Brassica cretica]|uniref:Uncharacterized protein n=1 Tax=Brassica cretica TaxID=69181 RepID=A0A8S9Q130_BRACR|nr:hypothetical protein F2Q69_00047315 [Brassica cretica]